jgi:hypothetical protein
MAAAEDSEWNDAQRAHRGLLPLAEEEGGGAGEVQDMQQLLQHIDEADAAVFKDRVVRGDVEPEEFKDEEEEAVFEEYRQQRLQQLRLQEKQARFGHMLHIDAQQFVREVTEASATHPVIVHMFKPGHEVSEKLQVQRCGVRCCCATLFKVTRPPPPPSPQSLLQQLAAKFAASKFVSIVYNNCIPDYPEAALPCLLVCVLPPLLRSLCCSVAGGMLLHCIFVTSTTPSPTPFL